MEEPVEVDVALGAIVASVVLRPGLGLAQMLESRPALLLLPLLGRRVVQRTLSSDQVGKHHELIRGHRLEPAVERVPGLALRQQRENPVEALAERGVLGRIQQLQAHRSEHRGFDETHEAIQFEQDVVGNVQVGPQAVDHLAGVCVGARMQAQRERGAAAVAEATVKRLEHLHRSRCLPVAAARHRRGQGGGRGGGGGVRRVVVVVVEVPVRVCDDVLQGVSRLLELWGGQEDQVECLDHGGGKGEVLLPHQEVADRREHFFGPQEGAQPPDHQRTPRLEQLQALVAPETVE
eukprot:CAMPEP_0197488704 /NCGR_PEP_ID=MMETSP1311-20131121/3644_1 /TAXON_ID=464262 /ORGANISM="Genus nov. species nov., Strain RCC856" /LENGTH=291 /DNA_ID=CAMNT_0043032845 /DNA_START=98 /DNA_END=970 /DNA_ORIENTATION=+